MKYIDTAKTLDEFADNVMDFAKKSFLGEKEPPPAIWLAQSPEGIFMIATPWKDNKEKYAITKQVFKMFNEKQVFRYAMISEVWAVRTNSKEEVEDMQAFESLEDHPDHTEALAIACAGIDGERIHMSCEIKRDENGKGYLVEEVTKIKNDKDGHNLTGSMFGNESRTQVQ
jgi:hypothetical protein